MTFIMQSSHVLYFKRLLRYMYDFHLVSSLSSVMINICCKISKELQNSADTHSGPGPLTMLVIIILSHTKPDSSVTKVITIATMDTSFSNGMLRS